MIRAGAALYGINPTPYKNNSPVKNPFKLLSPIIQLTDLPPGKSVGYNGTHVNNSKNSCKIATIPVGYADGISRSLSNKGAFYINGHKAPIIGIVSMDLTTIDVSNIPTQDLSLGQMVEVIGDNYTPDKIAKDCKTNAYEVLTMLGSRYKRIYT